MSEHVVDLTQVETVEGLGDLDTYAWLTALPVREQVVRCKDCKHFTANDEFWLEPPQVPFPMIGATSDSCDFWAGTKCKVEPNGFCAWGEVDE